MLCFGLLLHLDLFVVSTFLTNAYEPEIKTISYHSIPTFLFDKEGDGNIPENQWR